MSVILSRPQYVRGLPSRPWGRLLPAAQILQMHQYHVVSCPTVNFCIAFTHWGRDKWPPFRRHFGVRFLEWKLLNLKQNFTEICSLGCNWQYGSIGSDNGLAPNRRQAMIWSNVGVLCLLTHAYVTRPQWINDYVISSWQSVQYQKLKYQEKLYFQPEREGMNTQSYITQLPCLAVEDNLLLRHCLYVYEQHTTYKECPYI